MLNEILPSAYLHKKSIPPPPLAIILNRILPPTSLCDWRRQVAHSDWFSGFGFRFYGFCFRFTCFSLRFSCGCRFRGFGLRFNALSFRFTGFSFRFFWFPINIFSFELTGFTFRSIAWPLMASMAGRNKEMEDTGRTMAFDRFGVTETPEVRFFVSGWWLLATYFHICHSTLCVLCWFNCAGIRACMTRGPWFPRKWWLMMVVLLLVFML